MYVFMFINDMFVNDMFINDMFVNDMFILSTVHVTVAKQHSHHVIVM